MKNAFEKLNLYAVRSKDGKWFRSKGYSGSGESWVKDVNKARIYASSGPARAVVTFFAEKHPDYGVPDLVRLVVTEAITVDESDRIKINQEKKQRRLVNIRARNAQEAMSRAKKQLEKAQSEVNRLNKGV